MPIVHFYPGWMDAARLAVLVSALEKRGFQVEVLNETICKKPSSDEPTILLGHGYGAIVAASRLRREPTRFAAAAFWDMPFIPPVQTRLLLAMLKWERFRLGSDVPSRLFLSTPHVPPTVGQVIEVLRLNRQLVVKSAFDAVSRSMPLWLACGEKNLFEEKGFLNLKPSTCSANRQQKLNELNQNMIEEFSDWALHSIA